MVSTPEVGIPWLRKHELRVLGVLVRGMYAELRRKVSLSASGLSFSFCASPAGLEGGSEQGAAKFSQRSALSSDRRRGCSDVSPAEPTHRGGADDYRPKSRTKPSADHPWRKVFSRRKK